MFTKLKALVPLAVGAAAVATFAVAPSANAATPGCTAVPGLACGSWNSEVPGLPDLDVLGGAAVSGNSLIVYTRTATDKAEDFTVQAVPTGAVSVYGGFAPLAPAPVGSTNVRIQYSPNGVLSGLCVSTVNPVPGDDTPTQLRNCAPTLVAPGVYNPYQTFVRQDTGNPGDGQFVNFREVINHLALTNPAAGGSIGVVGNRVHVITRGYSGSVHQLWGLNGA